MSLKTFLGVILFFLSAKAIAQVTPNINSGNPVFPFPQFLPYKAEGGHSLGNLATQNAPGVSHEEMEKYMREAYEMICNATSYTGEEVSGVQYMIKNPKELSPGGDPCTCAEGDGYYLLAAAYLADKDVFDGLYMNMHDRAIRNVKRFYDGGRNEYEAGDMQVYSLGLNSLGDKSSPTELGGVNGFIGGSATDGDVDIALALMVAAMQWGENSGIILNDNGWNNYEISYVEEAKRYINAMADTVIAKHYAPATDVYNSGVIGLDGYFKDGEKQGPLTDWFGTEVTNYKGITKFDNSPTKLVYVDYHAPAYAHQFAEWFENDGDSPWVINQYKRAEASSDWLIGLHYSKDPKNIPFAGRVAPTPGTNNQDFTFTNFNPGGEDFRWAWRTLLNYVWHGNPQKTWNPVTHEVDIAQPNTFERDMGVRYANFIKNQQGEPWNNACRNIGDLSDVLTFKGPYTLLNGYEPDGTVEGAFPIPLAIGAGSPSAIVAQDVELMGEIFRHCASVWDGTPAGAENPTATYFHEWFRLLGMLVTSGNFQAPLQMVAQPNLKVYHKVDKTFAFTNDEVVFDVSYRNYGSVDASNSRIAFGIPEDFEFVSATGGGTLVGDSIVWNVGTIPGFKTGGLAATKDSVKVTLKIGSEASGNYCTNARISCSNGLGWVSNEYPNNVTAVMERNCVDVVKRALKISKTADREEYNPGQEVKYKVVFENSSDAGWINGGRPGVRFAFAHEDFAADGKDPSAEAANVLKYRLFHDAAEPYIDYGNYRVSYFMNDPSLKCYVGDAGCTNGWDLMNTIAEGVDPALVKVTHEPITPGSDANGSWNQRIVLQFSPQVATITQHLQQYAGSPSMVHEGGTAALRGVWRLFSSNYSNVDWTDDWSWDANVGDDDGGIYYPVSEDYTDLNNLGVPIDSWHKSACQTSPTIMKKVLVEEWDGYVWRRVFGNGPLPGRDIENVVVTDTLPVGISFKNFIKQRALGIDASTATLGDGRTVITWTISKMQVNQKDSILFTATVDGSCPGGEGERVNRAWISGNSESAVAASDEIMITCSPVTICPAPTTLTKSSDKTSYTTGETVEYSIEFTQTLGSIASPDLSTSTDWTITGSGAAFNANTLTLQNGSIVTALHDYSYGTNTLGAGIEGTIQLQTSETDFGIVVRDDIAVNIYTSGGTNPTYIDVYSGGTKVNTTPFSIPFSSNYYDFRITLNGPTLSMWLVATGSEISGAPVFSQSGLPIKAGYAGVSHGYFSNNPYGSHSITNWRTHMDVAFDVQINDPVPEGIINPTAISNSGYDDSGIIRWDLVSGKGLVNAMPYGATATLTWHGEYNKCEDITNIAYVNTRGMDTDLYGDCYEITCGTPPTCLTPTTATLTPNPSTGTACSPDKVLLTAEATGTTPVGGWQYAFFDADGSVQAVSDDDTFEASATGTYYVVISDPADAATCKEQSTAIEVTITPKPSVNITTTGSGLESCTGGVNLTALGSYTNYTWYNAADDSEVSTGNPSADALPTGDYYVIVSEGGCDSDKSASVSVKAYTTPTKPRLFSDGVEVIPTGDTYTVPICSGQNKHLAFEPYTSDYEFDIRRLFLFTLLDGKPVSAGDSAKVDITNSDIGNWGLNIYTDPPGGGTQEVKCASSPYTLAITSATAPTATILTPDTSYCNGGTGVQLRANNITGATYQWVDKNNGDAVVSTTNPSVELPAGEYGLTVTHGCSSTAPTTVTVTEKAAPPTPTITGATDTCSSSTVTLTAPLTTGSTYSWAITSGDATFEGTGTTTSEGVDQNQVNVLTTTEDVTITLKETDAQGCESPEATHSITINEVEAGVITGNETPACQATEAYTVTGGNATSYEWSATATDATPPTQTGTSYTVDFGVLNGQIEAIATLNGCTTPLTPLDITLQGCALKANIQTSALAVCAGEAITFTNISSGGTDFSWEFGTLQTAATEGPHQITLPEGTHDITLTVTDGALSDDSTITVTVKPQPETPTITGLQTVCSNTTESYQVTNPITTATYTWAAPTGASTDGSTTDQTEITFSSAAQSGDVTVEVNQDGCTATATHPITITEGLGDLGSITGEQVLCVDPTTPITYSVPALAGATSYTWTLPTGLTGTSTTETIAITATSTLADTIRVTANSGCGSSTQKLAVIVSDKPAQNTATLTDDQSGGTICVGEDITYTLNNVTGATTYQWDVPTGGTLKSQTDHQAIIEWTQTGDYIVGVTPINDNCGAGTVVTLPVTVSDKPSSVGIDGPASVCANSTETYEVNTTGVTQAATSYNWSVTEATFDGGFIGVSQVTINTGTANDYTVTVTPFNDCGTGESTDSVVIIQNNLVPEVSIETPEAVCENTTQTLTAKILKAGSNPQIRWFVDNVEQTSAANTAAPSFTFTGTQTYRVEVVSNASCKDPTNDQTQDELAITTTKEPIAGPFTQADTELCQGASGGYEIAPVTGASSYLWEAPGATLTTPSDGSSVVINNFTTNTKVTVTPVNNCFPTGGQSSEVDVTITPTTTPSISISADKTTICAGETVTYTIDNQANEGTGPTYQWQINGVEVPGETNTTYETTNLSHNDKVTVVLTSDKACVTSAVVTSNEVAITVSNQQDDFRVNIDGELAYCEDEQITFTASSTETVDNYYWKVNGQDMTNNTDELTIDFSTQTADTVEIRLSAGIQGGSCGEKRSEEFKRTITINKVPVTTINNGIISIELCAGDLLTLSSDSIRSNYIWKRNGMTLPNNTNPLNLVASKAIAGNYSLEVNNNDACGNTAATNTVAVTVFGTTGFSFNAEEYIVYKTKPFTATITPNEQGDYAVSYDPFQGIDILSQTDYQVTAVAPEKGNYHLIATLRDVNSTLAGCEYTDSLLIRSLEPFIIPNAFSPNGDQVNDKWEIAALIKYPDAWVQIVNRWGALLYEKDGNYVGNEWDGTYESEPMPVGTYYYMIDLKDPEKVFTKIMTGAVTITR